MMVILMRPLSVKTDKKGRPMTIVDMLMKIVS